MAYPPRYSVGIGPTLTPAVRYLVIASVAVHLLKSLGAGDEMVAFFGLRPYFVLSKLFIWQLGTYLFFHGDLIHILVNMFALWMFGCQLESTWGSRKFLKFFFVTGIGAGVLSVLFQPFSVIPIIGASGAIYGILMAYGMLYPERLVYIYFLFPVKVKYFVAFLGVVAFLSALNSPGGTIAHMAHLGGMVFAFLYLKGWLSLSRVRQDYYRWRIRQMRKRFEVHEGRDRKKEDDYWIH